MKIKLKDIRNSENSLLKLLNCQINVKAAYKISKLAKVIQSECKIIDENRIKLIDKYGEAADGQKKVKNENMQDFFKEYNEFLETETEIDFEKISIDELGNIDISPADLIALDCFITGEGG